jgi:hypothetical protein
VLVHGVVGCSVEAAGVVVLVVEEDERHCRRGALTYAVVGRNPFLRFGGEPGFLT